MMRKTFAAIAGACLLTAIPSAHASELEDALQLAQQGHYAEAAAIYRHVLAGNPSPEVKRNAQATLMTLETLIEVEHPSSAKAPAQKPVQKIASHPVTDATPASMHHAAPAPVAPAAAPAAVLPPLDAALALLQAGRYGEAAAIYRSILENNPTPEVKQHVEQALVRLELLMQQANAVPDLAAAKKTVEADPMNMDALFAYAQSAAAQGNAAEAEQAYLKMLALDPSLDRVRMDLALLYTQEGEYTKAQPLLEHVIANNPPPIVKARAEAMLAAAKNPLTRFHRYGFEGSVTAGYNYDSNGNSGSSTDAVSLFDTTVDLPDGSQAQDDGQAFVMGGLSHTYNLGADANHPGIATRWYSTANAYKSEQVSLDTLDLVVLSGRTGPIIEFADYRTTLDMKLGYTYVKLGGDHYLNVISGTTDVKYALTSTLALTAGIGMEDRAFFNNPNVSTNETRNGNAHQASTGIVYTPTPNDQITGELLVRRENAQVDYFTDVQAGLSTAYTHAFEHNIFTNLSAGYRNSTYDGPDPLISTAIREDKEVTGGIMLGKMFEPNILATLGYQYRNVDSNIQNYNYDNHRLMSSVGLRF